MQNNTQGKMTGTDVLQHLEVLLKIDNQGTPDFILIDDDHINNTISKKIIAILYPGAVVKTFTRPLEAVEYMLTEYGVPHDKKTIVLLDIDMPVINGWSFLERLARFPEEIKQQFFVHVLSSSTSNADMERASGNPMVTSFISKPLNGQHLMHGIF